MYEQVKPVNGANSSQHELTSHSDDATNDLTNSITTEDKEIDRVLYMLLFEAYYDGYVRMLVKKYSEKGYKTWKELII